MTEYTCGVVRCVMLCQIKLWCLVLCYVVIWYGVLRTYVGMLVCMYARTYACMYECTYVHMYACIYVCVCMCVYIYIYVCVCVLSSSFMHICMYVRVFVCLRGACAYIYVYVYLMPMSVLMYMCVHVCMCVCAYACACMDGWDEWICAYIYMRAYRYTDIHLFSRGIVRVQDVHAYMHMHTRHVSEDPPHHGGARAETFPGPRLRFTVQVARGLSRRLRAA